MKYGITYVVYTWIIAFMACYKNIETSTEMFALMNIKKIFKNIPQLQKPTNCNNNNHNKDHDSMEKWLQLI